MCIQVGVKEGPAKLMALAGIVESVTGRNLKMLM